MWTVFLLCMGMSCTRPHDQLPTPLMTNANWNWKMAEDWRLGFPYHRCDDDRRETGTYIAFTSDDLNYARGVLLRCPGYVR
jgi:hypothetical protein